jgi:hypothetical protein
MKTLTGMGGLGNAQELAELLRQMGRGPDSMLAHITPEEAQMLLESGGSGTMNPMTGLPEFVPTADNDYRAEILASEPPGYYGTSQTGFNEAVDAAVNNLPMTERMQYDTDFGADPSFQYTGQQPESFFRALQYTPQYMSEDLFLREKNQSPAETLRLQEYAQGLRTPQEVQPSILDRLKGGLQSAETGYQDFTQNYPMLSRLLTTGVSSLPAVLAARSARREGRSAANELRALGAPLREQAEALRQQALTGGLTPQQARQEEARRASMRQAASTRGATSGTQQAMIENTLARERAGLSETNLNNAIKQLNLANAYDEAAIRAKLQSDTQTANVLANILGNLAQATAGTSIPNQGQQNNQNRQTSQLTSSMPAEAVTRRAEVK